MTVGIAALCLDPSGGLMVIGAADRMLSVPDTEYEPAQHKVWTISTSIAAVWAGDTELVTELLTAVTEIVRKRIERHPHTWWEVENVARVYQSQYRRVAARRSESRILSPLRLTGETFISRQKEMNDSLVLQVAADLWNFQLPTAEIIFTGTDHKGTHIYSSINGDLAWRNAVGFAAVGSGASHANSQMMFRRHSKWTGVPDTLFSVHSAKRRAEVAPGVGKATDMFVIGPSLGSFFLIPEPLLNQLDTVYQGAQQATDKAIEEARQGIASYLEKLEADSAKNQTQEATVGPENGAEKP